jgi:hypothetical protein
MFCCAQNSWGCLKLGKVDVVGDDDHRMKISGVVVDPGTNGLVRGLLSSSIACALIINFNVVIHLNPNFRLFPFSDSQTQSFFDARREKLQHPERHIGPLHVFITVSQGDNPSQI